MYFRRNVEVDFVVPDEGLAVQVCYDLSDESTLRRECAALVALNKYRPFKRNLIISLDMDQTIAIDAIKVEVLPIWKWLLDE